MAIEVSGPSPPLFLFFLTFFLSQHAVARWKPVECGGAYVCCAAEIKIFLHILNVTVVLWSEVPAIVLRSAMIFVPVVSHSRCSVIWYSVHHLVKSTMLFGLSSGQLPICWHTAVVLINWCDSCWMHVPVWNFEHFPFSSFIYSCLISCYIWSLIVYSKLDYCEIEKGHKS